MNRLDYIWKNQNDLWSDYLSCLYDAVSKGDREGIATGSKIMLPNTFTGGPRYMYSHSLDALAIFRSLGNPQFSIAFTCDVKWPEIKCYMAQYPKLTPNDRAYIVCRVFEQKVDSKSELQDAQHIDEFISAEIPYPVEDPRGYELMTELMMYRPCDSANSSASCTQDGIYNKNFPKKYNDKTFFDINGHTQYRRRDTGVSVMKDFGLTLPLKHLIKDLENKLLMEENNYKRDLLKQEAAKSVPKLNHD
ncbi:DNA helicase [Tanacetum coccineum]